jgi:hypothetical protein
MSFMASKQKLDDHCPSECYQRKNWLDSLESAIPFEVFHLISDPALHQEDDSGLLLGEHWNVTIPLDPLYESPTRLP